MGKETYSPKVVKSILDNQESYIGRVLEKIEIRDELLGVNEELNKTSQFRRLDRIDESLRSDSKYISYMIEREGIRLRVEIGRGLIV